MGSKCCALCHSLCSKGCCCQSSFKKMGGKLKTCLNLIVTDPFVRPFSCLYIVTFLIILPLLCHDCHFSIYYHRSENKTVAQEFAREENSLRLSLAERYLAMLDQSGLHSALNRLQGDGAQVDVAISIVTVSRNRHKMDAYEPRYLTQVVWKFLSLLHRAQSEGFNHTVKLSICNVDTDPSSYLEAEKLSKLLPLWNRYGSASSWSDSILEKEKQDYVYCLNSSLTLNPRYILIIEDDALPYEDFFNVLEYVLDYYLDAQIVRGNIDYRPSPATWVKLYHPERLLSFFNPEPDRILELLGIGAFYGTLALFISSAIPYFALAKSSKNLLKSWIFLCVYCILVASAIGRAHLVEMRRLFSPYLMSYVRAPECCTPAMLYPREGAQQVTSYLASVKCKTGFGKDMALEEFKKSHYLPAYMVQPNMVKHIGMYSSLRKAVLDPFIV